jgi:hypothetical protein
MFKKVLKKAPIQICITGVIVGMAILGILVNFREGVIFFAYIAKSCVDPMILVAALIIGGAIKRFEVALVVLVVAAITVMVLVYQVSKTLQITSPAAEYFGILFAFLLIGSTASFLRVLTSEFWKSQGGEIKEDGQ